MFKPTERQQIRIEATLVSEQARKPGVSFRVGDFVYHVYVSNLL